MNRKRLNGFGDSLYSLSEGRVKAGVFHLGGGVYSKSHFMKYLIVVCITFCYRPCCLTASGL